MHAPSFTPVADTVSSCGTVLIDAATEFYRIKLDIERNRHYAMLKQRQRFLTRKNWEAAIELSCRSGVVSRHAPRIVESRTHEP